MLNHHPRATVQQNTSKILTIFCFHKMSRWYLTLFKSCVDKHTHTHTPTNGHYS